MEYFGTISSDKDMVDKSYVDNLIGGGSGGSGGYNTVSTLSNLPVNQKNIIAVLANNMSYSLSLFTDLSTGGELYIYIRTTSENGSIVQLPTTINGHPVSYNGTYDSTTSISAIQLSYQETKESLSFTTLTLHMFFDGTYYYVDKLNSVSILAN